MSTADKRTESITFRTTPAGKQAIVDDAAREQRDFSDMVRILIARGHEASNKLTSNRTFGASGGPREIHPYPKAGKR